MKRKTETSRRRKTATPNTHRKGRSPTGPSMEPVPGAAIPLDAEKVALASLEAMVRAEEANMEFDMPGKEATVRVRLSGPAIAELRAQAVERGVEPSKLAETILTVFLLRWKEIARKQ